MVKIKRCSLLCICLAFLLQSGGSELVLTAFADNAMKIEQKVYCGATMDDAFADDSILVVLKNEASLEYLETEKVEFSEIEYKEVRNLSSARGKKIRTMVEERAETPLLERALFKDPNENTISAYQQILCIELKERGKENVLEAIELLEQREDVLF